MTTPTPGYQGYAVPQQGYAVPQQGYAVPQQGYGPPQQAYGPIGYGPAPTPAPRKPWYARKVLIIPVVVIAVLVVLGVVFGSSSGMNVSSALTKALQGRPGITSVADVSCPSHVDTDAGSSTVCTASINGQPTKLTLNFDTNQHFVVTDAVPAG